MESVLGVIGLFVLRLGVPIVLMVLLSWGVSLYVQREEARALEAEKRATLAQAASASPGRTHHRQCRLGATCRHTASPYPASSKNAATSSASFNQPPPVAAACVRNTCSRSARSNHFFTARTNPTAASSANGL